MALVLWVIIITQSFLFIISYVIDLSYLNSVELISMIDPLEVRNAS